MTSNQNAVTGACQCGAVTFETRGEPAAVLQCHCLNCQKSSGAGHVPFAVFPDAQLSIEGKTKSFAYKADSGATATSVFCPECGSSMFSTTTGFPGTTAVRLGVMDDSSIFQPQIEVYMKRLRKWDHDLKGTPAFEMMPPAQK
jgi:hypothetical protein